MFFLIIKIHVVEKVLRFIKKQNNFLKINDFEKQSKGYGSNYKGKVHSQKFGIAKCSKVLRAVRAKGRWGSGAVN